jgi:hypothetical protein
MKRVLVLAVLLAGPAAAEWRVAETAHFRVYAELPEKDLRRRAEVLEDFRDMLGTFSSAKVADDVPRLDVYIVGNISAAVPFGRIAPTVGGFYSAGDGGIAAYSIDGDFGRRALLHEYAHHHMFASTGLSYPGWYVEGFAEYFMTATFQPGRIDFGLPDPARVQSLVYGNWLSWEKLVDPGARRRRDDAAMFYAQSWLLTHYLFRTPGMAEKNRAYLTAVARGEPALAAFKAHVHPDPAALGRTLERYVRSSKFTFSRYTRPEAKPAAVTITPLPPSADAMLMMYAALERGAAALPAEDRPAALAKVRAAAARFPGDDLAARTLAMAELALGSPAAALAQIDTLLARQPADPQLQRLKAQALLQIGGPDAVPAARRLLVQVARAVPNDWRALHIYLHTYDIAHTRVPQSVADVVQRAWELAPQVDGLTIDMAAMLVQRDRLPEAAQVLAPVAFEPHNGQYSALARALRTAALAGDKAGFVKALDAGPAAAIAAEEAGDGEDAGRRAGGGR